MGKASGRYEPNQCERETRVVATPAASNHARLCAWMAVFQKQLRGIWSAFLPRHGCFGGGHILDNY